jgi:hypothetical protein
MMLNRFQKGDKVVVSSVNSRYRGREGTIQSFTPSGVSARVAFVGEETSRGRCV